MVNSEFNRNILDCTRRAAKIVASLIDEMSHVDVNYVVSDDMVANLAIIDQSLKNIEAVIEGANHGNT